MNSGLARPDAQAYLSAMGFYATDTLVPAPPAITGTRRARRETACGRKPLRGPIRNAISGYRFYNPELGRWLNRDPIGEVGGVNVYGIAHNNLVGNYDFLGLLRRKQAGIILTQYLRRFNTCACTSIQPTRYRCYQQLLAYVKEGEYKDFLENLAIDMLLMPFGKIDGRLPWRLIRANLPTIISLIQSKELTADQIVDSVIESASEIEGGAIFEHSLLRNLVVSLGKSYTVYTLESPFQHVQAFNRSGRKSDGYEISCKFTISSDESAGFLNFNIPIGSEIAIRGACTYKWDKDRANISRPPCGCSGTIQISADGMTERRDIKINKEKIEIKAYDGSGREYDLPRSPLFH